jgi:DNA-binding NarL/FixJ family response regulator
MIIQVLPLHTAIRVTVVSGDRIFREVLAASLANLESLEVRASPGPAQDPGIDGQEEDTDVVLIDAACDREQALDWTCGAAEQWPEAKVIAVGIDREDASVVDFVEAGALGVVLKGATLDGLLETIRAVHQGRTFCSPKMVASVLARIVSLAPLRTVSPAREVEPLTPREREILALVAAGLSNKEVGRCLCITVQTVKNHVHRILAKLQVQRRREAIRLAYDLGLLAEPREAPLLAEAGASAGRERRG